MANYCAHVAGVGSRSSWPGTCYSGHPTKQGCLNTGRQPRRSLLHVLDPSFKRPRAAAAAAVSFPRDTNLHQPVHSVLCERTATGPRRHMHHVVGKSHTAIEPIKEACPFVISFQGRKLSSIPSPRWAACATAPCSSVPEAARTQARSQNGAVGCSL